MLVFFGLLELVRSNDEKVFGAGVGAELCRVCGPIGVKSRHPAEGFDSRDLQAIY